jgi:hypothetical protein
MGPRLSRAWLSPITSEMRWHTTWHSAAIVFILIAMRAGTCPNERGFVAGLGLMGIASVVALLREQFVIPRHFWAGFLLVAVCSSWEGRMQNSTKKASLFFAVIAVIVSGVILYFR